jgi:hypothetical protein
VILVLFVVFSVVGYFAHRHFQRKAYHSPGSRSLLAFAVVPILLS